MSTIHENEHEHRSLPELIRELRDESTALLRGEIALAKAEMSEKVARVSRSTVGILVGGALAYAGLIFLLLAATAGVELGLAAAGIPIQGDWLAPLIVGAVTLIIGLVMALSAKKRLENTNVVPEKTVNSLKEDKQWIQNKMR